MDSNDSKTTDSIIKKAPVGLAVLAMLGPSLVWCAEYIGSGEVILATRTGAILGTAVLWAIVLGIFLKFWIGMSGARYTVCTGEGMIDMLDRMPGPSHWAVWVVRRRSDLRWTRTFASGSNDALRHRHALHPLLQRGLASCGPGRVVFRWINGALRRLVRRNE